MAKPTIFIYSIVRNESKYVDRYYKQIRQIVTSFPEYSFLLSIYENDSTDGTPELLQAKDWSFLKDFSFISEKIMTTH